MNLTELQRAFRAHVLGGDGSIDAVVARSEAASASARLAVYADAYRSRLTDALAHNYPRLQQLLGTDSFDSVARHYTLAHPSSNPSVRWFGDQMGTHLATEFPDQPVLAELAQWEWAIAAAFDAADAEVLAESALSAVDPSQWIALRFALHPSARRLHMRTNAPSIFKALTEGIDPPQPSTQEAPQAWLIWRQDMTPRYRSLPDDENAALAALVDGATFEGVCDALCEWHDATDVPLRAAILLKGWIRDEMISSAAS